MDVDSENKALHLLSELLVQIRGIAGDAADRGHVSCLGRGRFTPEEACRAMAIQNAAASSLLAGVQPSATALANLHKVSLKALIADAKRCHSR